MIEKHERRNWIFLSQTKFRMAVPRRAHHLARALLGQGHRVIWVDGGRSLPGKLKSLLSRDTEEATECKEWLRGGVIVSPSVPWPLPPKSLPDVLRRIFFRVALLRNIVREIARENQTYIFVEHPRFLPLVYMLKERFPDAVLLYCMSDDVILFQRDPASRRRLEIMQRKLIEMADGIVSVVPYFIEKYLGGIEKPTCILPNGVSIELMTRERFLQVDKLNELPHPRIGFVGAITDILYWPMMIKLVEDHPAWSFIFAGQVDANIADKWSYLEKFPNVNYLGVVPYQALGLVLEAFDVGLIPFNPENTRLKELDDLKLKEYLAFGLPIVTFNRFALFSEIPGAIRQVRSYEEFEQAVEEAADARYDAGLLDKRRGLVLDRYNWVYLGEELAQFAVRLG